MLEAYLGRRECKESKTRVGKRRCRMKEFKKIFCPLDLSDVSPKIVPYVLTMAEKFDADIYLLFVARVFKYYENIYVPSVSIHSFERDLLNGARKRLDEFVEEYFTDSSRVHTEVVCGDPADEIVEYVEREGMDLVIIGTHGRKGIENIVFGSVAEKVVINSPAPVMSVNPYRE
jgi:nucleotide-binding universal stress UspA family protein